MDISLLSKIDSETAGDLLSQGLPLVNLFIQGDFKIIRDTAYQKEIVINNCIVENFDGSSTQFEIPIKLTNTHFIDCHFEFSYFSKGLLIENCVFEKYLDFQAGGHNQIGYPIAISNNTFLDFVNFFDCWYNGEVFVTNNNFSKGTNIESKNQYITFGKVPSIINNTGQTNIESEFA